MSLISSLPSEHDDQSKGLHNNDQDIELIKPTNTLTATNLQQTERMDEDVNPSSEHFDQMESVSKVQDDSTISRPSETTPMIHHSNSVSLKSLLSYQDVINAIEREFHLREGQEHEIIMKLWLKGQTMISILQRFRHLLQDLNIDDKDFVNGLKQIRELINYSHHDVQHFREQITLLENENRFLEHEFQRQLDRLVHEKNEQIVRLTHLIDQSYSPSKDNHEQTKHSSGAEELLLEKFMQHNVELQREIETLRARLEYTFTLLNEKFDQQKPSTTSVSLIQTAFEQIRRTEINYQELKSKSVSQQEENDFLKYLIRKSQGITKIDQQESFRTIEKHALEREINRIRHELEITEQRRIQLEQRFENADQSVKFHIEKMKLDCDILRKHILTCTQRLDEINKQNQQHESIEQKKILQLENDLLKAREQYNELAEHTNTLKFELNHIRKQIHEKEKLESNSDLEKERRYARQLENDLKSLRAKYDDVCERVTAATHQLERVKVVLEETSRRCEQLEKEKVEINLQSHTLSQNVVNVTARYKEKLHTMKSRLDQTERERREADNHMEQLQNEIERLKDELSQKKDVIYEKEKIIQDSQYQTRDNLLERQTVEERIINESKRFNELLEKTRLLEEELDRFRREQIIDRRTEMDLPIYDSSKDLEELRSKIIELETRFADETTNKDSLQVQIKILEEENIDLRTIMHQMRKRSQESQRDDRDRNDEIQKLIARAEFNARHYMTNINLATLTSPSTLVRIVPLSSSEKLC